MGHRLRGAMFIFRSEGNGEFFIFYPDKKKKKERKKKRFCSVDECTIDFFSYFYDDFCFLHPSFPLYYSPLRVGNVNVDPRETTPFFFCFIYRKKKKHTNEEKLIV